MEGLYDALDIADIAELTRHSVADVSQLHFALGSRLGLQPLQQQIDTLPAGGYWDNLAKIALSDDLAGLQRAIALEVLAKGSAAPALQQWEEDNRLEIDSARKLLAELADARNPDLAMLSVALRKLRNLA
jgi:glutamate dehydrogenase